MYTRPFQAPRSFFLCFRCAAFVARKTITNPFRSFNCTVCTNEFWGGMNTRSNHCVQAPSSAIQSCPLSAGSIDFKNCEKYGQLFSTQQSFNTLYSSQPFAPKAFAKNLPLFTIVPNSTCPLTVQPFAFFIPLRFSTVRGSGTFGSDLQ